MHNPTSVDKHTQRFHQQLPSERKHGVDHSQMHPGVHSSALDWSEDQVLHVACPISNPIRWQARRKLFHDFRHHMHHSPNVVLHVGELAYGDRPFDVTHADHRYDYQFRTRHELWHKENLINLIVQRFPPGWKYGAYIDGDLTFTRHDWALETIHQLQHYEWVQMFSSITDLGSKHEPHGTRGSFMYNYWNSPQQCGDYYNVPRSRREGAPGGAWAFRREAFDAVGSLLDICILGAADSHMVLGLVGKTSERHHEVVGCGDAYRDAILNWQMRARVLNYNIGCVDAHVMHHWHGPKARRGYPDRWKILQRNHYNPHIDVFRDHRGVLQLSPNKPNLRDDIRAYFRQRNEDHPS